jgi:hypothetical protein
MRRWLLVVSLFMLASTARAEALRGAWHITQHSRGLQVELTRDHSHFGHTMPIDAFRGLDLSVLQSSSETPARFQLVRDAGTIDFTGAFLDGDGVGRFTFTPDNGYADRLRGLGVVPTDIDDERLFHLAAMDVSTAFIREMQSLGYRESLDRYTAFRIHGVSADFIRAMQSYGYASLSAERLVAFRIHGVTPDFVRDMKAAGYDKLSADQLVAFRIHGVSPQFARDMRELGVTGLNEDQLVAMRIHGVRSEYVRELAELGYRNLSSDQLVSMRIHGVTTKFIRELAAAGYRSIPVDKLVSMRIHGIDAEFVRTLK